LKINDESVIQEEYTKIVDLIRELSSQGPIKFEVIDKSLYRSINQQQTTSNNEIIAHDFTPMNKQIKMLDLSECDLNKLYSMLSHSHYINHPAFYNIKEHLIKMENTNSKFEIEEILGISPEFI
jgi:hypothetical protein